MAFVTEYSSTSYSSVLFRQVALHLGYLSLSHHVARCFVANSKKRAELALIHWRGLVGNFSLGLIRHWLKSIRGEGAADQSAVLVLRNNSICIGVGYQCGNGRIVEVRERLLDCLCGGAVLCRDLC